MENEYKHVVYGEAKFSIEEGMYSIEEIENLLALFKAAKINQHDALIKSMQKMEVPHVRAD